jgi:cytoskeleton protein RodZ
MPSIGDSLREARIRQRLDIADVEQRTKIRAKYLRALENEEFALLPGSTFVKTFLRTYAEELGLDPHVLVEEYRQSFEPPDELEVPLAPQPGGPPRDRERRYPGGPPARGTVIVVAVVAVLAFLLVLGLTGNDNEKKGKQTAGTSTSKGKPVRKRHKRPKPLPSAVTLKVAPTVPTYVCLDNGPGTTIVYQGILQQAQTFKGKKLRINLGKSSVQLNANGKPVRFPQTANPLGFEFSVTGHKELPVGQRPCAAPGA